MKEGGGDGQAGAVVVANAGPKARAENKPKEIVFVVDNGKAKAMPVKRGISDGSFIEIMDGVGEGAQVVSGSYKAINRELEDGTKVRIEEQKKTADKPGTASNG
jgi:hypothetical protein